MTVRPRSLASWMIGFVAVGLVFGGLSVEVLTGAQVSRAQRALPGALARAVPTMAHADHGSEALVAEDGAAAATRQLVAARRHADTQAFAKSAQDLEVVLEENPTALFHQLAAQARLAAGDGMAAGRHAQLAARLAPEDATLARAADDAVDLAVAWSIRPVSRPLGIFGATLLFFFLAAGWRRARERRRREAFLDEVTGRMRLWVDGEPAQSGAVLPAHAESLLIDVFLSGRYGLRCPKRPQQGPTLHLAWSNASSSQTIRQRAVPDVHDTAIRVAVKPDTLQKLLARPGPWRLHARLGDRPLASLPVTVAPPRPQALAREPRRRGLFRLVGS
jgi:hypothetical protein